MITHQRWNLLSFKKETNYKKKFFSWEGEKQDIDIKIGPFSRVKFIAARFSVSRGTFGLTLKPKLMQIKYQERDNIFEECLLDSDDEKVEPIVYNNPDYGFDDSD